MYVKRHKVRRGGREYVYLRLVEAYRDPGGQVRHRLLRTLGREDQLKESGQLDQLTRTQRTILALLNIPLPWPEDTSEPAKP